MDTDKVREIRRRAAAGEYHRNLAGEFGVSLSMVRAIVQRLRWKGVA